MTMKITYLMSMWLERTHLLLTDNIQYILAILVVTALFGAFLAYTPYVDPGTDVEEFEESSWSSTAAFTHQATVTQQTAVFDEGETLTDRSSYLEAVSPRLNGSYSYQYEASSGGSLDVTTDLTLVLRSADEETEYWREQSQLASVTEESVPPGQETVASFSVNITALNERIDEIEEELDGTPGNTEILVRAHLTLVGERNSLEIDEESTHEMTIESQGNVYTVDGADPVTDSDQQFGQETVEASYSPLRTIGGPLLLVVSLAGIAGVAIGRRQGWFSVTEKRREWMAYQASKSEFGEWISNGSVPTELEDRTVIDVDSLEGLVDVAIDSDRRVIADQSRGVCVVVLEDAVYRYEPPAPPTDGGDPLGPGSSTAMNGEGQSQGNGESTASAEVERDPESMDGTGKSETNNATEANENTSAPDRTSD